MMQPSDHFKQQLRAYKDAIDADIALYASHVEQHTLQQYGPYPAEVASTFLDVLSRGGKRIRGALAIAAYEMCGGTDRGMITRAATALEMLNTYILMIDDVQDRSAVRRGKPTAHKQLESYHKRHELKGDGPHTGVSLALNAALGGMHAAQMLLTGLAVEDDRKIKALGIINQAMLVTAHGQTQDIMNELVETVNVADVEHVLEWKTAYYTFLNPLCVGMVLAGAGCEDTDAIRPFALGAGKAFQITDDIIGIFGSDAQTGKSAIDDLREGKQTLLTTYALRNAPSGDATFLRSCLGNARLRTDDALRCRTIIADSGALSAARDQAQRHIDTALAALDQSGSRWQPAGVAFLRQLASSMVDRTA
jgi:geranylgeranyl diphosphate synthase, type I